MRTGKENFHVPDRMKWCPLRRAGTIENKLTLLSGLPQINAQHPAQFDVINARLLAVVSDRPQKIMAVDYKKHRYLGFPTYHHKSQLSYAAKPLFQ